MPDSTNTAPVARDDSINVAAGSVILIDIATDLLGNDGDADGDTLTLASFTQPSNGTLVDNGDGTLTYTPDEGYTGPDSFTYTASDGTESDTATVDLTVADGSMIVSDDFSQASLGNIWTVEGPAGTAGTVQENGEGYLALSVPDDGSAYDAWNANTALRAMQDAPDGDFQVTAKYLSTPAARFEIQGILVEQDADNWLRFDTHTDGTRHYVFAAVTVDGGTSSVLRQKVGEGDAAYLRVTRSGDTWTLEYSADGSAWSTAGSFTHALQVSSVGPFAGASPEAGGYTAKLDYFETASDPIVDEDGTVPVPPVAEDDAFGVVVDTPLSLSVAEDLLANDSDANGDPLSLVGFTQPSNGTLVDNGDGTLTYTPATGYEGPDSFTYTVSDGNGGSDTATVALYVNTTGNFPPVAEDDTARARIGAPLVIAVADLLANDRDAEGAALSLTGFTQPAHGTLVDNGDGTLTYTPEDGYIGLDGFSYTITDGLDTDTADVELVVEPVIEVWYGETQTFGQIGVPQTWVNILGNVDTTDLVDLSFSLNGGEERPLSVGPDTRRLQDLGDFNVDLAYDELDGTATDDIVTIKATLGNGQVFTQDVTIDYEAGNRWPTNYSIDWATVQDIQSVAQVVDGLWSVSDLGVRPSQPGYDRLVAIGDQFWDNYEANLSITINEFGSDPAGRDGGGFALGFLWTGHTDSPIKGWQPKAGWRPVSDAFFVDNNADGEGYWAVPDGDGSDRSDAVVTEGETYNITLRIEQVNVIDRMYSMKFWREGDPEPSEWTVQGVETFHEPRTGSFLLNAHYYDVTFGDVSFAEIEGDDTVPGTSGDDLLAAVDTSASSPGQGEIDVLRGFEGADTFVLGEAGQVYYDDGVDGSAGLDDYALIWDFETGIDTIRLAGAADDYVLADAPADKPAGTAIYRVAANSEDELVGITNGVTGLSLTSDDFLFDPLMA
jgi:regulation of enolase protein 1 (concanavalin A-like superfamily)